MAPPGTEWWRSASIYQVYLRSFADGNGDGVGDIAGLRARLPYLRDLGVDALWIAPWYPSPMADGGYDVADYCDIDPLFGTLAAADALLADAHELRLRVVLDIVPNHCSNRHRWFAEALAAGPGSPERGRFWFRPGRGPNGEEPPNDWPSHFGGPAWTRVADGEWYLHLFAPEQPDFNWESPDVVAEFERILRFWLDRGVDGFRIDVAHGLLKDATLADEPEPFPAGGFSSDWRTAIDQPGVHEIYRDWRRLVGSYPGDRVLVGEIVFTSQARVAPYLRPDELQLAFNFSLLSQEWDAGAIRASIDESLAALPIVTWVLENHDVTRLVTRFGEREARAAALLLLALPGPAFIYQGQELGLEEVDLPDESRQDPIFRRSNGERLGRDGCRVPIPWSRELPERSWLPVPAEWAERSVEAQLDDDTSFLALYTRALRARPRGRFAWLEAPDGALAFERGDLTCVVNVAAAPIPVADVVVASEELGEALPPGAAAWVRRA